MFEIITQLNNIGATGRLNYAKRRKEIWDEILKYTTFLPDESSDNQRLYHFMSQNNNVTYCHICNTSPAIFGTIEVRENGKYIRKEMGYKVCSKECRNKEHSERSKIQVNTKEFKEKREKTLLKRYGTTNTSSGIFAIKKENTLKEKHGVYVDYKSKSAKYLVDMIILEESKTTDYNVLLTIYGDTINYLTKFLDDVYTNISYSQRLWHIRKNNLAVINCNVCNKNPSSFHKKTLSYTSCSKGCGNNIVSKKAKISSNDISIKEKQKNTLIKNLGNNPYDVIYEKVKKTNMIRYGTEIPSQSPYVRKKQLDVLKCKTQDLLPDDYLLINNENYRQLILKHKDHEFIINGHILLNRKSKNKEICTECLPLYTYADESEVYDFIISIYDGEVIRNDRSTVRDDKQRYELDLYLPELNLAIEYNGLYWHSEDMVGKYYHRNKVNACNKKNIHLINIWEDDWKWRNDIVKSILSANIGKNNVIYARKCEVSIITDKNMVKDFFEMNHIQGYATNTIVYGLKYDGELVSAVLFLYMDNKWVLQRFCNKLYTNIVGGATRLLKYFMNDNDPKTIITYCGRDIFRGHVYEKMGFKNMGVQTVTYTFFKQNENIRIHRRSLQKKRLEKHGIKTDGKTYKQLMSESGYLKIYDGGLIKFEWTYGGI
jgi:hypothetical protein